MKETIINHVLGYEFVYIFCFCFIIFLLMAILIKRKTIRRICTLIFSVFFVFFSFEFVLSLFMVKIETGWYFDRFAKVDCNNIRKTEEISYFNDKNIKIKTIKTGNINTVDSNKIIYDVVYSAFENGLRYTKCNFNAPQTYVFLGCSFTYGDGLNDDETLPYYFSELYNFGKNIINCGVRGHSSNTAINILNNYEMLLSLINENKKIEHCFYSLIEDHIYRNFRIQDPSDIKIYKDKKWIINKQPYGILKKIFIKSYMFRKIFLPMIDDYYNKEYYYEYMINSLMEINKIIEEKYNSKLTVIVWPYYNDEEFNKKLRETDLDLIFLPRNFVSEEEGYAIKYDRHPSSKVNKEIAEILYNHINEKDKIN